MSATFLIGYGACLHITAARAPVPTLAFAFERHIPLVPMLIVPYMSIDLFFLGSFFLCTRRMELHAHVKRLALVIGVATVCFLLFPLQMASHRPAIEGVWGPWFASLDALDRPYNLAPSLHIAQWTILCVVYARHTRGWLKTIVAIWFALIFVSTLFTWQHHVFDVVTGQALGLAELYLVRERPPDPDKLARFRPESGIFGHLRALLWCPAPVAASGRNRASSCILVHLVHLPAPWAGPPAGAPGVRPSPTPPDRAQSCARSRTMKLRIRKKPRKTPQKIPQSAGIAVTPFARL